MTDKEYSQRRACRLVVLAPKTYRYASKRPDVCNESDRGYVS